jgi:hypothetical protein
MHHKALDVAKPVLESGSFRQGIFRKANSNLACLDRDIGPLGRAGIELPWPPDALQRVLDHLLPLGDPANRARDSEQHGEHVGRET